MKNKNIADHRLFIGFEKKIDASGNEILSPIINPALKTLDFPSPDNDQIGHNQQFNHHARRLRTRDSKLRP